MGALFRAAEPDKKARPRIVRRILLHCKLKRPPLRRAFDHFSVVVDGFDKSAPAPVDRKLGRTALVDPDTGSIPAPRASLDALGTGYLPADVGATGAAEVD